MEITQVSVLIHDFEVSDSGHEVDWSADLVALDGDGHVIRQATFPLDAATAQEISESVGSAVASFVGPGYSFEEHDLPDYEEGESTAIINLR